ncbi:MAG TPA: PD-(D/E)XK nuclease family protein [Bdellovibrionota bacterium]|nr:PD-(D/E)XK nuclease family protein [Bdellovibrionota bacterium]
MNYHELLQHFTGNSRVAFLVPNAHAKRLIIDDLLTHNPGSSIQGVVGKRIFSFNDFVLKKPLSQLEDAFALERAVVHVLKSKAFQNMAFYEFVQRTLKVLSRADLDVSILEKAHCPRLLVELYQHYQKETSCFGQTKLQIFRESIENFSHIKNTFFKDIDEVVALGIGATHYLEQKFLIEFQKSGLAYFDFNEALFNLQPPEIVTCIPKNRIEEVKKVYELAKESSYHNPELKQTFIFKNLYLYRDILDSYFPAPFQFHPALDLLQTPFCTFLFSLLENKEDYEKIEHYVGSSYIADEITVDGLKQFLKSFPIKASFSEYFSKLLDFLKFIRVSHQIYSTFQKTTGVSPWMNDTNNPEAESREGPLRQRRRSEDNSRVSLLRRDLKAYQRIIELSNDINKLGHSQQAVDFHHFLNFLKLLISHQTYSENRKNGAAYLACDFRNITFWQGDVLYLLGFHREEDRENPLLSEKTIRKINDLCGEKRILERAERLLQEERIVLSNIHLKERKIYVLRPKSSEGKVYLWPKYLEKLPQKELKENNTYVFYPDEKTAYIQKSYQSYQKNVLARDLGSILYAHNAMRYHDYSFSLSTLKSLPLIEELGSLKTQGEIVKRFRKAYSASQLESYSHCGYRYFIENILGVRENIEDKFELTPLDRGSVYHESLHRFYTLRKNRGKTKIQPEDVPLAQKQMAWAVETSFKQYQKPVLWRFDQDRVMRLLSQFCKQEALEEGVPTHFEVSFRMPTGIKDFFGEEIILRGIIDRIDMCDDKFLVIDYKTGSQLPSLVSIERGESFQLPIYKMAAENCFAKDKKEGEAVFYQLGDFKKKIRLTEKKYKKLEAVFLSYLIKQVSLMKRAQFYRRYSYCQWCSLDPVCRLEKKS